jgi:hypothetical protein
MALVTLPRTAYPNLLQNSSALLQVTLQPVDFTRSRCASHESPRPSRSLCLSQPGQAQSMLREPLSELDRMGATRSIIQWLS